ncbi:MAG: reverse transcriptase family protein [Flavobacteriales bacterium]|nr:reverse transcriptase family protein [Flavobacteriales bacterium]
MIAKLDSLARCLDLRPELLLKLAEDTERYYYENPIVQEKPDGSTKTRITTPTKGVLEIVQKRIEKRILKKLPLPEYAHGSVKGRSNVQVGKYHAGGRWFLNTDMANFFPGISHDQVFGMFLSRGFSPDIARLLTKLTTYKGALPQGTSTSPLLANLVFVPTGLKIERYCERHGIRFRSFVDDLSFSSKTDFKTHVQKLLELMIADGFRVNYKKTNYRYGSSEMVGVEVNGKGTRAPQRLYDKYSRLPVDSPSRVGTKLYIERVKSRL